MNFSNSSNAFLRIYIYDGLHQSRTQTFHGQAGVSSDRSFRQLRGRNDLGARIGTNV